MSQALTILFLHWLFLSKVVAMSLFLVMVVCFLSFHVLVTSLWDAILQSFLVPLFEFCVVCTIIWSKWCSWVAFLVEERLFCDVKCKFRISQTTHSNFHFLCFSFYKKPPKSKPWRVISKQDNLEIDSKHGKLRSTFVWLVENSMETNHINFEQFVKNSFDHVDLTN